MSSFEIFLIVSLCLAPFIALIFVLPKIKKKEKQAPPTTEYKPETSVEAKTPQHEVKPQEQQTKEVVSSNEFKDYLSFKRSSLSKPKFMDNPKNVFTEEYIPNRLRRPKQKQEPKTISEQIQDLSPELKVMMLSGVFNKKDFEE